MRISDRTRRNGVYWLSAAALALAICPLAQAASVTVGTHILLPNTANQVVSIWVNGGEQIAGEDFFAQIGDGGAFLGGSNTKPAFTNVDVLSGTIFAANNNGAFGDPNGTPSGSNAAHPLIWVDGTTTVSGTVSASGLLATLTLDTTGHRVGHISAAADRCGQLAGSLRHDAARCQWRCDSPFDHQRLADRGDSKYWRLQPRRRH